MSPIRILVLCTGNSARSQIAEALLTHRGAGRIEAASAGVAPAPRVSRFAVEVLGEAGIDWSGRAPKAPDALADRTWDIVLTVCDHAREVCPVLPGAAMVHWGLPDPADVRPDDARRTAFRDVFRVLSARIDAFLALPLESLTAEERVAAMERLAD